MLCRRQYLGMAREDFQRKFAMGREHARDLFTGMELPTALDQVVVHGFAGAPDRRRLLGGGSS